MIICCKDEAPAGLFHLGKIVVTPGVMDTYFDDYDFLALSLSRHVKADWGDLCEEDRFQNFVAVMVGERILSNYGNIKGDIWIITEADRSVTTILLPSEY